MSSRLPCANSQSTAQTYKSLYDNFLQRYMESVQQQSFPITEARLISSASRPSAKEQPQNPSCPGDRPACGGMILGFGIGMLRDLSDRVFRTSEQVESLLQTDCIGLVPLLTGDEAGEASSELGEVQRRSTCALQAVVTVRPAEGKASASSLSDKTARGRTDPGLGLWRRQRTLGRRQCAILAFCGGDTLH